MSSTCSHNMVNFGLLAAEIGWPVWGTPANFKPLASVTARHLVVGVSQTLRRWTEGATYIRQGDHHVGHWPTFLVNSATDRFIFKIYVRLSNTSERQKHLNFISPLSNILNTLPTATLRSHAPSEKLNAGLTVAVQEQIAPPPCRMSINQCISWLGCLVFSS